ncbi:hypothetical protein TWF481_002918 [Arthrobotrys musiformis]|uniref:Uncharacterized protein n=1 Tax=Arthrobotrys musiformis TaxID=47236 RepID=A0AAV9VTD5_9PEZI
MDSSDPNAYVPTSHQPRTHSKHSKRVVVTTPSFISYKPDQYKPSDFTFEQAYIGTFKVNFEDMTLKFTGATGTEQRPLESDHVHNLADSFSNLGVNRTDATHAMEGTCAHKQWRDYCAMSSGDPATMGLEILRLNRGDVRADDSEAVAWVRLAKVNEFLLDYKKDSSDRRLLEADLVALEKKTFDNKGDGIKNGLRTTWNGNLRSSITRLLQIKGYGASFSTSPWQRLTSARVKPLIVSTVDLAVEFWERNFPGEEIHHVDSSTIEEFCKYPGSFKVDKAFWRGLFFKGAKGGCTGVPEVQFLRYSTAGRVMHGYFSFQSEQTKLHQASLFSKESNLSQTKGQKHQLQTRADFTARPGRFQVTPFEIRAQAPFTVGNWTHPTSAPGANRVLVTTPRICTQSAAHNTFKSDFNIFFALVENTEIGSFDGKEMCELWLFSGLFRNAG